MNIVDQHLHSAFSFDAKENLEEYVKEAKRRGDTAVLTTEHVDIDATFTDVVTVPDFALWRGTAEELSKKYGIDVMLGLEVGYKKGVQHKNEALLAAEPVDIVLLSVHESESCDVSYDEFLPDGTPDEKYSKYLDHVITAVENFDNFDVLGHVDYLLRWHVGKTDLSLHTNKLVRIFDTLIAKGKALEFNTKSHAKLIGGGDSSLREIFSLYRSRGGELVSVGSDSHVLQNFKMGFDGALALLREIGFEYVCQYKGREMTKYPII